MPLLLSACSSFDSSTRGMSDDVSITAADIPNEPDKDTIVAAISSSPSNDIADIIGANFSLVDVVTENSNTAEIYATTQFSLSELADVLTNAVTPDEVSELIDNQQIFIYPNDFVTIKESEADDQVLLIEVASESFVRENYSPSFLQTYFTIRLLDSLFGNNWSSQRSLACQTGDCYGGYSGRNATDYGTTRRGSSTYRGGGPSFGK